MATPIPMPASWPAERGFELLVDEVVGVGPTIDEDKVVIEIEEAADVEVDEDEDEEVDDDFDDVELDEETGVELATALWMMLHLTS